MKRKFVIITALCIAAAALFSACPPADEDSTGDFPEYPFWTVSFDSDGGSKIPAIYVAQDTAVGDKWPANPVRQGYIFDGWYEADDADFSLAYTSGVAIFNDTSLKAKWLSPNDCWTVNFDSDGGSAIAAVQVEKGKSLGARWPANPVKDGFDFDGWYRDDDTGYTQKIQSYYTINEDLTLKAKWIAAGFIITFNYNGALLYEGAPTSIRVTVGDSIGPLPTPQLASSDLLGWFTSLTDEGGTASEPVTADYVPTASITLYARWKFNGLAVENPLFEESPLPAHGTFTGEYDAETGNWSVSSGALRWAFPTGDDFDIDDYDYWHLDFTLVEGDGSITGIAIVQYGSNNLQTSGIANNQPWLSNVKGTGLRGNIDGATGDVRGIAFRLQSGSHFVVRFDKISFYKLPRYTVTFDLGYSGATGTPAPVTGVKEGYGLGEDMPSDPQRVHETPGESWEFLGWYDEVNNRIMATSAINSDLLLTAKWSDEEYTDPRYIEYIDVKGNVTVPLYGFIIPEGDKLSNYTKITAKIKNPSASSRLRVWGTFPATIWNAETKAAGNVQNAASGLLLVTGSADSISANNTGTWSEYNLIFNKDATYNTNPTSTGAWDDNASGLIIVAVGVIGQAGNNDPRTYYIKDIALSNADGSKTIDALRPDDAQLWEGNGAGAYAQQSGANSGLIRTLMRYEE